MSVGTICLRWRSAGMKAIIGTSRPKIFQARPSTPLREGNNVHGHREIETLGRRIPPHFPSLCVIPHSALSLSSRHRSHTHTHNPSTACVCR